MAIVLFIINGDEYLQPIPSSKLFSIKFPTIIGEALSQLSIPFPTELTYDFSHLLLLIWLLEIITLS